MTARPSVTTPLFSISQTPTTLTLAIRAPHSRPHDIEVSADGPTFTFLCNPYALHLCFDHPVYLHQPIDAPPQHTTYDFSTGLAHVTLRKSIPGTVFERLDLLNTLLHPSPDSPTSRQPFAAPSIEVLSSTQNPLSADDTENHPAQSCQSLEETTSITRTLVSLNEQFAETVDVSGLDIPLKELTLTRPTYGFASRYEAVFSVRAEDASQIVLLPDPDLTPKWRRPALRKAAEDAKFDADHYMADYLLEDEFAFIFDYTPKERSRPTEGLEGLPKREYLGEVDRIAAADLAGILFASSYDERITLGERNVESGWTISRLSPTMAYLEQMKSPREAILAAYRRSLAYPLYRSVKLAEHVLRDMKEIFRAEIPRMRSTLLNILMELRDIFEDDQLLRLHCDLFLIDYCVWIQSVNDSVLEGIANEVQTVLIERHELEWDLKALEDRANQMMNGKDLQESEVRAKPKSPEKEVGRVENGTGRPEIVITARSSLAPTPGLECVPMSTIMLNPPVTYGPPDEPSASTEYDSDSSWSTDSSRSPGFLHPDFP